VWVLGQNEMQQGDDAYSEKRSIPVVRIDAGPLENRVTESHAQRDQRNEVHVDGYKKPLEGKLQGLIITTGITLS